MDGADSADRPTVELFVKVRLLKPLEPRQLSCDESTTPDHHRPVRAGASA